MVLEIDSSLIISLIETKIKGTLSPFGQILRLENIRVLMYI